MFTGEVFPSKKKKKRKKSEEEDLNFSIQVPALQSGKTFFHFHSFFHTLFFAFS